MPLARIREKFQVTIPRALRHRYPFAVGDFVEVGLRGKTLTLSAKSIIDREIAEGEADYAAGRSDGPFTAEEAIAFLHAGAAAHKRHRARIRGRHT